jgi:pyrroloquinoline quinone (PQQ) biosynthesis protein C
MAGDLKERLLRIMDAKDHWAWPYFTKAGLTKSQLLVHFQHEYQTYVRDFPVLLARVLGQGPPTEVRDALSENIFEEQTGKLSIGVSHPQLFLEMMAGLGFSPADLEDSSNIQPEAKHYRSVLERVSIDPPWQIGAAVLTIFVEGSKHERADLEGKREQRPVEEAIQQHPLVLHYGCPPENMRLVRAHRMVEGGHREDAWRMLFANVEENSALAKEIIVRVEEAHGAWHAYRDGVARAMGLRK